MIESKKYGLMESDIRDIVGILQKNDKVQQAILFGSRAKGCFHNGSDVDIALLGTGLKLNDILDISIEIEELMLLYKFDLIIYDRIKERALLQHINRVGISLFERK